jgi:hypothetical protein
VVVTSNYHPRDIFKDEATQEAVLRRFKVIHMSEPFAPERAIEEGLERLSLEEEIETDSE